MVTRIIVPDAGQITDEMVLIKWRVTRGQRVVKGEVLAELETDKSVMELESVGNGCVLKMLADEGDKVAVGQAILLLGEPGEEIVEASTPSTTPSRSPGMARLSDSPIPPTAPEESSSRGRILATPAARTAARMLGVGLEGIKGHGPSGCIVRADVGPRNSVSTGQAVPHTTG